MDTLTLWLKARAFYGCLKRDPQTGLSTRERRDLVVLRDEVRALRRALAAVPIPPRPTRAKGEADWVSLRSDALQRAHGSPSIYTLRAVLGLATLTEAIELMRKARGIEKDDSWRALALAEWLWLDSRGGEDDAVG